MMKIFLKIQIEVKMISASQNFHFVEGGRTTLSYITVTASLVLTLPLYCLPLLLLPTFPPPLPLESYCIHIPSPESSVGHATHFSFNLLLTIKCSFSPLSMILFCAHQHILFTWSLLQKQPYIVTDLH